MGDIFKPEWIVRTCSTCSDGRRARRALGGGQHCCLCCNAPGNEQDVVEEHVREVMRRHEECVPLERGGLYSEHHAKKGQCPDRHRTPLVHCVSCKCSKEKQRDIILLKRRQRWNVLTNERIRTRVKIVAVTRAAGKFMLDSVHEV